MTAYITSIGSTDAQGSVTVASSSINSSPQVIGYPFYPISAKLFELKELGDGWHFGEGLALSVAAIDFARDISLMLCELRIKDQNCFPGVYGEMRVTGYIGTIYCEITRETNGTISLFLENSLANEELYKNDVSLKEMKARITSFLGRKECFIVDSSVNDIGIQNSTDFKILLLGTHRMEAAYQSFKPLAQ